MARNVVVCDDREGYYHVINRVVGRAFLLKSREKEKLVQLIHSLSTFYGVEVLAYTVMSNHYHLLVKKPQKKVISNAELMRRWTVLYGEQAALHRMNELKQFRQHAGEAAYQEQLARIKSRFFDLSVFMQELQQRFTRWYNKRHSRCGTLWEDRYKSVLIEGSTFSLHRVAAYIELNAVRAGIVKDPKSYRYCSYGAALVGVPFAKQGLQQLFHFGSMVQLSWPEMLKRYRQALYGSQKDLSPEAIRRKLKNNGLLTTDQLLRCRVRYMCDGLVIGSKDFVDHFLEEHRPYFGDKRKSGARRMSGGEWGRLFSFRDLQQDVVTCSSR